MDIFFCLSCLPTQFYPKLHCKYLNAWFECNDIVISVYSHFPLNSNAKSSDTEGNTFSIRWFRIWIERVMTVHIQKLWNHCIQILHSDIYSVFILLWSKPKWQNDCHSELGQKMALYGTTYIHLTCQLSCWMTSKHLKSQKRRLHIYMYINTYNTS